MSSASSDGVTTMVERDCGECFDPSWSRDPSSGFASDEDAGAGVPWLVAEPDAGIQPAFRASCQIDCGRPEHPDSLHFLGEPLFGWSSAVQGPIGCWAARSEAVLRAQPAKTIVWCPWQDSNLQPAV